MESAVTRRIGVYGGTFDPIHKGHLRVATALCEAFAFDQFLFVPAFVPPHKRSREIASPYHRYAMTVLATMNDDRMQVSTIEIETPTRPYTIETLARLQAQMPEERLFFIMGADSFAEVTSWYAYEQLLTKYDVIVAARPGYDVKMQTLAAHLPDDLRGRVVDLRGQRRPDLKDFATPRIFLTDYVAVDIAATEVREKARKGLLLDDDVPQAVAEYIVKYRLYKSDE